MNATLCRGRETIWVVGGDVRERQFRLSSSCPIREGLDASKVGFVNGYTIRERTGRSLWTSKEPDRCRTSCRRGVAAPASCEGADDARFYAGSTRRIIPRPNRIISSEMDILGPSDRSDITLYYSVRYTRFVIDFEFIYAIIFDLQQYFEIVSKLYSYVYKF